MCFSIFIIVFDETLNLAPTYPHMRRGTQNYVVLGKKPCICWLIVVKECLGHILAVKHCLYACTGGGLSLCLYRDRTGKTLLVC